MSDALKTFTGTFTDFRLLDSGDGYRLEQWGPYRLARPDPQAIWQRHIPAGEWAKADATFDGSGERGRWNLRTRMPAVWTVTYKLPDGKATQLKARLTPFKHTGIFAEQCANWEWMSARTAGRQCKILNLFAYSGAASVILTGQGHFVTHVDASKPAIAWAKENQVLNKLPDDSIRWILEDAAAFVKREVRRGQTYDGILLDPPAFGHSPDGKTWKFSRDVPLLLADCVSLLSDIPAFLLVNAYATNSSAIALKNIMEDAIGKKGGVMEYGELCLQQEDKRLLSTGIVTRWSP